MIELLQAFILVLDDIMDSSITRRGQPCWYLMPNVGMIAVNDASMLESSTYLLLKRCFKSHPAYLDVVELFHEVSLQIELGQTYDVLHLRRRGPRPPRLARRRGFVPAPRGRHHAAQWETLQGPLAKLMRQTHEKLAALLL